MALEKPSEKLLKCFLDYDQMFPYDDPILNFRNACPVIITFCDAPAYSRSFSEAVVDFRLGGGLPWSYFFQVGHDELMQYILGKKEKRNGAIILLENFVANIEKHTNCLKCLYDKTERERKGITSKQIQVIIATHLFGPLAGDKSYTLRNKGFSKDVRGCPVCEQDITAMLGNTSFGNGSVWHGFADIFVKRSIVKVAKELVVNTSCEGESYEPFRKRRRDEDCDDNYNSENSDESDSVVEVKKDCIDANTISQGLAQTIVNAYCEAQNHHSLKKSFVPSFIASSQHVKIAMYNCDNDRLMLSPDLNLFVKLDVDQDTVLNLSTILSIWYALNFEVYIDNFDLFEGMIPVSNFQKMAGSKLPLYQNHCSKPMQVKAEKTPVEYNVNVDYRQLVAKIIDKQIEHRKQLKQLLNEKKSS